MATKQLEDRTALLCDDCGVEIFVNENMVMLNDELWQEIVDEDKQESYCHDCIEKRMGRNIEVYDFKESSMSGMIPCNQMWMWENRREEYLKMHPEH